MIFYVASQIFSTCSDIVWCVALNVLVYACDMVEWYCILLVISVYMYGYILTHGITIYLLV